MKISVLMLNYDGKEVTCQAIESLLKSHFPKKDFEIVVVDNASLDGSAEAIKNKFPHIKVVKNKKNLGSGGINYGLPYCQGEFIFFTNNDITLERDCLSELYNLIKKQKNIAIVAPKYINHFSKETEGNGTWISRSFYSGYIKKLSKKDINIPYIGIGLIRKSIVKKLGYLFDDDYFLYGEDVDLGLRTRLLGLDIIYHPQAIIYHMHALTTKKMISSPKIIYLMERNLLTTFYKICSFKSILLLSFYIYLMRFVAIIKDILTLKILNAFARFEAILWVITHPIFLIKKHQESQKNRKVGDKFLFKVFSEKYLFFK